MDQDFFVRVAAEVTSAATIVGATLGFLPTVATLLAVCWYSLEIFEWNRRRRQRNRLQHPLR